MKLFDRFKKFIACAVLVCFIPSQAWAQGITIPASSSLNLNGGQLIVSGGITIQTGGTLKTVTSPITLTGNWANSGTFTAGTGTVNFSGTSGTQTITSGGTGGGETFYNLTHNAASTVQLLTDPVLINNNFINTTAGIFNANSLDMTVDGNWENTATFTPGTENVTLNGSNQNIIGSTTFSSLTKTVSSADTLTFDHTGTQTITKKLTLTGAVNPNRLSLHSDSPPNKAALTLQSGGLQNISDVSVQYSNAGGGIELIGRNDSVDEAPGGTNINWAFGNATITWLGGTSTEFQDPTNWNAGVVPAAGDTVIIPPLSVSVTHEPDLCPSSHVNPCAAVNVGNLTIQSNASLTLSGQNLTVALVAPAVGVFSNSGTVNLRGNETVTLTQDTTDHGTFNYEGTGTGATDTLLSSYYNLIIDDTNTTKDAFVTSGAVTTAGDMTVTSVGTLTTNGSLTADGNLTLTAGTLDISTHSNTLTVGGTLSLGASAVLTATNGNIAANGAVSISSGATFTAPGSGKTFTVSGNFTNNAGNYVSGSHPTGFNNSSGTVTLNGGDQSVFGSTNFYQFNKIVTTAHTLTFDHTGLQNFTNNLTLEGASGQLLSIRSDLSGTQADIALISGVGVTQNISEVNVQYSNAGALPTDATLIARNNSVDAPPTGTNTNWIFQSGAMFTWTGATSTEWNVATNWNLGAVPSVSGGDIVTIPNTSNQPNLCPAGHVDPCTAVSVASLTIKSGASLTLNGQGLTVTSGAGNFSNSGTVYLNGNEAVSLTQDTTDHGTFEYQGTGAGSTDTILSSYYNLVIDDAHNGGSSPNLPDTFSIGTNALHVFGNLTMTAGTLDMSAGTAEIDGAVSISSGSTLKAPSATGSTSFTVAGNWSNSGGTFTASGGKVTFNGTSQTISGSTTFSQFSKTVSTAATLTFDHLGTQTFTSNLTLQGTSGQLLSILSDSPGVQANIALSTGGTQSINFVNVQDSNASGGLVLVGRNASAGSPTQHNTNWQFGSATLTWTGSASTDWNNPANWNLGLVPVAGDTVTIPSAPANQPKLSGPVSVGKLTIDSGASLTLNGNNLTVTAGAGTFTNSGNLILDGTETVSLTQDTNTADTGTFTYVGNGTNSVIPIISFGAPDYYNLVLNGTNTFQTTTNITTTGSVTVTSGTLDISTHSNTLTVGGALSLGGSSSVLTATNGNIAAGSVSIAAGDTFTAPGSSGTFTVAGNFTNNAGNYVPVTHVTGFNNSSGTVTFNTAATAIITGSTVFNNLTSIIPGKTIQITAGSTQTVSHTLTLEGTKANPIILNSTGAPWNLDLSTTQLVSGVNVEGSDATDTVDCLNCVDSGNNTDWVFETLSIVVPAVGTTVGQTPTIIGVGPASTNISIKDASNNLVATVTSDVNGNFRVVVGQDNDNLSTTTIASGTQLATGANSLTPYITSSNTPALPPVSLTVTATPSINQVPTITSPVNGAHLTGSMPTVTGQGAANQPVTIEAITYQGSNQVLTPVGSGTVASNGTYSVTLTTPLPSLTNYLSATVGTATTETASALIMVSLTDPFGTVFDSSTNTPITIATVSLYRASDNQLAQPSICDSNGHIITQKDLACTDVNPFITGPTSSNQQPGVYSFLAVPGTYYMKVTAPGYSYPTKLTTLPAGRDVVAGSKGDQFVIGNTVTEIDQPMDGNGMLLRITKTANKSQGSVGDIVMYTVNIQNVSPNPVTNVLLNDQIPPGFKYIKDRVLLNSASTSEPAGQRPLIFNIGNIGIGTTEVLQYQLVIGSGVTMGNYQNTATARYASGLVISNPAQASVKIVPDPVFDLGTVIGKVFFDWNENGIQDPPFYDPVSHETIVEKPVPNVQIIMEDGTIITTDRNGQYNIPGLLPGRHIFRLDERTLPPGAYMTTDKAVIADITAGSISKVNFGVNIDESQVSGRDAVFFNEKIRLTQDTNRPVPRLNAALFDASAGADPKTEEILLYNGILVRQVEFRVFTNYSPFINSWRLDIMDADTHQLIKRIEGTPLNINDPIYWDGRDTHDVIINPDHKYSYVFSVADNKDNRDDTKEKPITVRQIKDEDGFKKEHEETKDVLKDRADRYRKWLDAQAAVNNLDHQLIRVQGETIHLDRQGTDVKSIHVMKGNHLFTDIPLVEQYGLTPDELMAGGFSTSDEKDNLEIIIPNGDYTLDVVSVKAPNDSSSPNAPAAVPQSVPVSGSMPSRTLSSSSPGTLEHYSRPLKVGDDYMMFVALGDAQVGYNIDRGNIEPIQDATQEPGFYKEGKGAFYLKGQILGKYLITSSYDSDRAQKALFRQLDPNTYYPVYGDGSSINYDATDTQGPLYLKVEWDKSSAILGNYVIDFNDTDFAAFSQKYYGGMINYQSVSNNPYGDARTKLVIFHAQVQQQPSHNEFLATGGSLYFLKYKEVVQGSDTVTIQVRDQTTGLVVASQTMTNGADYELDNSQGSILFWEPVSMIAQSESIISNNLINGDPIYVVVDYQYEVSGMQIQGSQGARVAQAVGDNVVLGGTYIQDNSSGQNYTLEGTDATLHVNKDSTVKAEYAQSTSQETGSYVSTDGGITFTPLMLDSSVSGKAYGIKGDTRLFDNIGLKTYYKWIGNNFGATDTTSQQGTEKMGMSMTFDMTPVTRLTASEDIQRLLAQNNLQTATQIGASETDTTMVQIVHTAQRLKLTGQFQLIETKNVINGVESTTNQRGATMGGQAQYDLTNHIKLTLGQQVDVVNRNNTATTLGAADRVTDHTTLNIQEVMSSQGKALTAGVTNQINNKMSLTTAYTLTNLNTGETDKTASVGVSNQINKNITTTGTVAQTASSTGSNTTSVSVGTKAKLSDTATLDMSVGKSQNTLGGAQGGTNVSLNGTTQVGDTTITGTAQQAYGGAIASPDMLVGSTSTPMGSTGLTVPTNPLSTETMPLGIGTTGVTTMSSVGVIATTKVNANTSTNGSINVANDSSGGKTTTFGFGNNSKLDQELQAVTDNSFSFSPGSGTIDNSKYGLVNTNQTGQKTEADFTQQTANQPGIVSESNIYGLSGDVNDKLAVNGSVQRGKVQNLGTSQSTITDFSLGSGYVLKDTESAEARLKNSIKLELRVDKGIGTDSLRQYVLYDALEAKINDNTSVNTKVDYSKTMDTTTNAVAERHEEIILGMAYRPVNFDNLNLISEYSYQDGYGGGLQQADALNTNVNQTVTQVFSAEGVYDINDKWQAAEKIAYRIEDEQDTGFAFTQTHTWLVIHRLNYKIDRNWTISGEYRDLVQVEAKDNKQGILLEATRDINENTQLAIGWNFTDYTDDLTNLSYTSQGPFVRMTGKFYDETPQERARARAKWLDARISEWAWILIRKELAKKDSKIVLELNRMFVLAKEAQKAGRLEESRQIYKDVIAAGQMMFDEASEHIRSRINFEEQMQQLDKTAREYFKGGEYVKARKIWEKVVDEASRGVVK